MTVETVRAGQGDKKIIFYLDDDQDDLDIFRDVVAGLNVNVSATTLSCSDQLMAALLNPPPTPSVLFLDLNMPRKSGLEVLEDLRRSPTLGGLPVVILSTSADRYIIEQCRKKGANLYISKATDYQEFTKSIAHALTIDWPNFQPDGSEFLYSG